MRIASRKALGLLCALSVVTPASLILPIDGANAQVRMTPRTAQRTAAFNCPNNRFTNGDFTNAPAGKGPGQVEHRPDQDINLAEGWKAPWTDLSGASLADLFSSTEQISNVPAATAPDGNYAGMWIGNMAEQSAQFREGMYNQLATPITANSDIHQFTFKAAHLYDGASGPSYVGIYGIKRNAGDPPIAAPTTHTNPTNRNLYGPGKVVHLATVQLPATAPIGIWQQHTVTFPTSNFGSLNEITHVLVTKADAADGAATATQRRYVAFDDFCMQTAKDAGIGDTTGTPVNTNCPGTGCTDQTFSTCCPPSANSKLSKMLASVQPTIGDDYYLKFTLDPALDAQMTAYGAYLKLLDPSYTGMAMTVRAFDGGSGSSPSVSGGPLEPEKAIYWNAGTPAGVQWPAGDLFSPATKRPVDNWTVVETVIWHTGPNRPWSMDCSIKRIAFRPQVVGGRTLPGTRGFKEYTGAPPASAAQRPTRR